MRLFCCLPSLMMLFFAGTSAAPGQDTRRVLEPHIPPTCMVLQARLAAVDGVLPADAERDLDTARIQQAIDQCAAGQSVGHAAGHSVSKSVELRSNGRQQTFLSGPLTLRSGVTLVIDANTSLAASVNPRLYDTTPGSCGTLGEHGQGCKPLLSGNDISASGIMGDGSIEGRGGARIVGARPGEESVSWWELAHKAKVLDKIPESARAPRVQPRA